MAKGWWGIITPFATLVAPIGNIYSYRATRSLHEPEGKSPQKYALIHIPLCL